MKARLVRVVYLKELRDALRDRRTIISTLVVPVLIFPVIMFAFGAVAARSMQQVQREGHTVMVLGGENAPALVTAIKNAPGVQLVSPARDFEERISRKHLRIAVSIPPNFQEQLRAATSLTNVPAVTIFDYAGEMRSQFALATVQKALRSYADSIVASRLQAHGLSPRTLKPFETTEKNVAAPEKVGGNILGGFIPYIIIFLSFVGALPAAIDLTAGEKERGTIETILATPLSRMDLAAGKFLLVLTASIATTVFALTSFAITFSVPFLAARQLSAMGPHAIHFEISASAIAAVFVMVLPLAVMFSAGLLALALFARTYKEAQSYAQPLSVLVILPAMAAMLPGFESNHLLAFVPILNVSLISKELLTGTYEPTQLGIVLISSCIYAALALLAARTAFNRESVLFRT